MATTWLVAGCGVVSAAKVSGPGGGTVPPPPILEHEVEIAGVTAARPTQVRHAAEVHHAVDHCGHVGRPDVAVGDERQLVRGMWENQSVDPTMVIVKYTYVRDSDWNGSIDN